MSLGIGVLGALVIAEILIEVAGLLAFCEEQLMKRISSHLSDEWIRDKELVTTNQC